jgi:hypothetical protein
MIMRNNATKKIRYPAAKGESRLTPLCGAERLTDVLGTFGSGDVIMDCFASVFNGGSDLATKGTGRLSMSGTLKEADPSFFSI